MMNGMMSVMQPREAVQPARRDQGADAGDVARVDPVDEVGGQARADDDAGRERQECNTRLERAVAHDVLDVLAQEEEHREHGGGGEEHRDEAGRPGPIGEDPERQQGVLDPALDHDEQSQERDACHEAGDRPRVAPSLGASTRKAVDHAEQAQGAGDGAGQVELARV